MILSHIFLFFKDKTLFNSLREAKFDLALVDLIGKLWLAIVDLISKLWLAVLDLIGKLWLAIVDLIDKLCLANVVYINVIGLGIRSVGFRANCSFFDKKRANLSFCSYCNERFALFCQKTKLKKLKSARIPTKERIPNPGYLSGYCETL